MNTARRARSLAGALVLTVTGGWAMSAGPAAAAPPVITDITPAADARLTSQGVTVTAKVAMPGGRLKSVRLAVTPLGPGSTPPPQTVTVNEVPQRDVSFSVNLPLNGRYRATITATGNDNLTDLLGPDKSTTATREFLVLTPPATPRDVKATLNPDSRHVSVSWARNTEPDMLFYLVQRSRSGSADSVLVAKTEETGFVDAATAEAGGEYSYQVVAVRRGATATEGVNSNPSSDSRVTVPDPPAPATTTPPPPAPGDTTVTTAAGAPGAPSTSVAPSPPGSTPAGPSTTVPANSPGALTRSGSVDLSGFRTLQTRAVRPVSPPTTSDPGFTETLPFDTQVPGTEDDTELGTEEEGAPEGGTGVDEAAIDDTELGADDTAERTRALAFLAAGLLATVLLMHVLWVKGEVDRMPLEPLPPAPAKKQKKGPPSAPPPEAGAAPAPLAQEWARPEPPAPAPDERSRRARRPSKREDLTVG